MTRTDLLNYLIERYGYKTYIEIGMDNGQNFGRVNVERKWGVDPICPASYPMTSDKFFASNNNAKYDLIFVDGLHEEEQVIRDIENSLKVLSTGGTIVVHDCNPKEEQHQTEKRYGQPHWNGTVWKAWVRVRASHDDLSMFVLDLDEGCGIIQRGVSHAKVFPPTVLTWQWLVNNRNMALNLVSFDEWKKLTGDAILSNMFQYWDANPPEEVLHWMNSWDAHHNNWNYTRFDEASARQFLREKLGSRHLAAYDSCLLVSSKSNVLRYCALYSMGGVWIDSDIECMASIDGIWCSAKRGAIVREARPVASLPITGFIKPSIGESEVRNDFLMFKKPGDKLLERMLNLSLANIENSDGSTGTSWNFTGPGIWCDLFKRDEKAYEGMNIIWYGSQTEWVYHEHRYKKQGDYWANVKKGTPIFREVE
jgi:hypothetical protein